MRPRSLKAELRGLPSSARRCPRTRQVGVGLIEVLVALLVLSIAFLGMAAMQAISLSTNNSAMVRSTAIIQAYSIQDAMRADRANAISGIYNGKVTATSCPSSDGTLAGNQLNNWCVALGNSLGKRDSTSGEVSCDSTGCLVTVQFDDSRSGAGGTAIQRVATKGML